MLARWNAGEKTSIFSRSRTCLALLLMVPLETPNAALNWSGVQCGCCEASNRKLTCPMA